MFDAFYSDPHFGHTNILKHANRPFTSIEEHDYELVERYNRVITRSSTLVLWLGDCFWHAGKDPDRTRELLSSMRGRKALLLGNHDGPMFKMAGLGFEFVAERLHMVIAGREVVACHYPDAGGLIRPWDSKFEHLAPRLAPGRFVMHGHTHVRYKRQDNRIHVGVDAWDYTPAQRYEIEELLK